MIGRNPQSYKQAISPTATQIVVLGNCFSARGVEGAARVNSPSSRRLRARMHPALHGHQHCTVLGLDAQRYRVTDGELEELFVRLRSVSVRWVLWWVRMQSGPLRPVVARALAEAVRFELTDPCGSAVFKTAGLNHSPKPPGPAIRIVAQGVRAALRFGNATPRPSWEGPGADK